MALSLVYRIAQVVISAESWSEITAPINCSCLVIKNSSGVDISICTNTEDSTTIDTIPNDAQEGFLSGPPTTYGGFKFRQGKIVCFLKSTSGNATVTLKWAV